MRRLLPLSSRLLAPMLLAPGACTSVHDRIYQPPTAAFAAEALPAGGRLIGVTSRDGLKITGAAVPAKDGRPTLLVFHGNASDAAGMLAWLAPLIADGYGVVAAEYRGYAGNPGRPDEAGLAADADAFYTEARRLAAGGRVYVIGHSLGGGVAFGLARRQRLDALVTVGTFTRLRAMAPRIARVLVHDRFDNLAAVPALDEPLFLIHGTADDTVPAAEARQLQEAASAAHNPGEGFAIAGAGHHPDGAMLAAILRAIDARVAHPGAPAPSLPANVTVVPY